MCRGASNEHPWFAVRVKFRHEKVVASALRGKGFHEFLPLYKSHHRSGGRIQQVELPLFPTYLFCQFDPQRPLPILTIPGVFGITGGHNAFWPVDPEQFAAVRVITASGLSCTPISQCRGGDCVYVEDGPLRGTRGVLERWKNANRLIVSVTILQRSVAVEIDHSWVRPFQASNGANLLYSSRNERERSFR